MREGRGGRDGEIAHLEEAQDAEGEETGREALDGGGEGDDVVGNEIDDLRLLEKREEDKLLLEPAVVIARVEHLAVGAEKV